MNMNDIMTTRSCVASDDKFIRNIILPWIPPTSDIKFHFCEYDQAYFDRSHYELYKIELPKNLENAVPKRHASFLAGRYSAVRALNNLGVEPGSISTGDHGSPLFPSGVRASLSHSECKAIAVASSESSVRFLGVDIEKIMSCSSAANIQDMVLELEEFAILKHCSSSLGLTLAFSMKESVFKALYPLVRCYFDFNAVKIIHFSWPDGRMRLMVTKSLSGNVVKGDYIDGWFWVFEDWVLTLVFKSRNTD